MDAYIGLDVSLASTAICAVSAQGEIVKETTAASEPEDLVATLKAMPGDVIAVGLEAGPLSQWLYRHLTNAGFAAVLMETRQVKGALKAMPIKTDRRDAEGIARLVQMGWYPEMGWLPPFPERHQRANICGAQGHIDGEGRQHERYNDRG
jgi:transposase